MGLGFRVYGRWLRVYRVKRDGRGVIGGLEGDDDGVSDPRRDEEQPRGVGYGEDGCVVFERRVVEGYEGVRGVVPPSLGFEI